MRAWQISSFGVDSLEFVERPTPLPGPGEVLVAVRANSLNFRDLMMVKGLYNPKMRLPRIPCSDGAGEVVDVGPGVTAWKPGDRVAGIFMQNWLDGPLTAARLEGALGGDIDGMLADFVVLKETGLVAIARALELSGSGHAAMRGGDGVERARRRRPEAGRYRADPGDGRSLDFRAAVCAAARRTRDRHLIEQRKAGPSRRNGTGRRTELPREPGVGPLGTGSDQRRRRGPGGGGGRIGDAAAFAQSHSGRRNGGADGRLLAPPSRSPFRSADSAQDGAHPRNLCRFAPAISWR